MTQLTYATRSEGFCYALAAFAIMFFIGSFLCATIIGATVGVPLILISLWSLVTSPLAYRRLRAGACPHCGARCLFPFGSKTRKCPECKLRMLVRGEELKKIQDCEGQAKSR